MEQYRLGQVFIVSPEVPFRELDQDLRASGFERDDGGLAHPPLVVGEPEFAGWKWRTGKPYITYTFNPVAHLRVLDVATLPPTLRGRLANRLKLTRPEDVGALLKDADARARLRGLWVAGETERLDLMGAVEPLKADREAVVAQVAGEVLTRLRRVHEARLQVLAQLRLLAEAAKGFLPKLSEPAFVATLRPTRDDCAKLFDAEWADALAGDVAKQWARVPTANPGPHYSELEVTAAAAGLMRYSNELSDAFPSGYRDIAGWMTPNRVWLAWVWKAKDGGTVRYDGLAWLDDHWVWFPKPFRALAPRVLAPLGAADTGASH